MANHSRICLILLQIWTTFTNQLKSNFMATLSYIFHMYEQNSTTTCSVKCFVFCYPILVTFLQLKYQGNDKTGPYDDYPKTMLLSQNSFLICCLKYGVEQRFSSHPLYRKFSHLIHLVMIFFSSLSLSPIASALFPDSASPVVFLLCFMLFGGEMFYLVFKNVVQQFEEESYFRRRGETGWNFVRRRMDMVLYPVE